MTPYPYDVRFSRPHFHWGEAEQRALETMVDTGWVSNSDHVRQLEQAYQERFEVPYAIACSSATQGLILALRACHWHDMRVLLPAFTWPSTAFAVELNHSTAVFGDIDADTWLLDESSVTEPYDAVLAVDIFGNQHPAGSTKPLIVDAAHGFGLTGLGRRGLVEVVSMSNTKIPTAGEGGMILTHDPALAQSLAEDRRLASRMPEASAIIGLQSIDSYDDLQVRRQAIIDTYLRELDFPFTKQQGTESWNYSVFAVALPSTELRDRLVLALQQAGIESKVYYEPLRAGLPVTDDLFARLLALPVYPAVSACQSHIIDILNRTATANSL